MKSVVEAAIVVFFAISAFSQTVTFVRISLPAAEGGLVGFRKLRITAGWSCKRGSPSRGNMRHAIINTALLCVAAGVSIVGLAQGSRIFSQPALVKGSPTNLGSFDVSWNDNAKQRYYFSDRTNNAIDLVDAATDTFLGFIGKGQYTGTRLV